MSTLDGRRGYRLYRDGDIAVLRRQALVASGWSPKEASKAAVSGEARLGRMPIGLWPAETAPDLVAAAAALDPVAVGRMLDERFATSSFEQIVEGWLLPELEHLGTAWADGRVSVAGEHMVAAAVQRRLSAAFDAAGQDSGRSPLVRVFLGLLAMSSESSASRPRPAGRGWRCCTWGQICRSGTG